MLEIPIPYLQFDFIKTKRIAGGCLCSFALMKLVHLAIALLAIVIVSCKSTDKGQKEANANRIVGFYNLENLFDTINDPSINDEEFLPDSKKEYGTERYNEKLAHLAKVIAEFKPDMLGVCEVENKQVLIDLCGTLSLNHELDYSVSHHNSPDKRGIDVAFIYQSSKFKAERLTAHTVILEGEPNFKTRDIVCLTATDGNDSFYFFANHWPSRSGGQAESEYKRTAAAFWLNKRVTGLQKRNPDARIIIMGDFNDEPFNTSIVNYLKADSILTSKTNLFNTSYHLIKKGEGTYNYRGDWNVLDQIIVSQNLVNGDLTDYEIEPASAQVVKKDFMLYTTRSGQKVPSRSYGGPNYYGGYSDHLPTFVTLLTRK
ncbi:MAG: endonuclease/exonuclease/phosphatase family protein [Bacteroidia bacterium]